MIKDRRDIRELVNNIERTYPVEDWKHNGYYLWPVLRICLYMHLVKMTEKSRGNNISHNYSRFYQIWQIFASVKDYFFIDHKIDTVYLGAPSHCVNLNGRRYNRYYDPLMDQDDSIPLYLDKSSINKKGAYKPERQLLFSNLLEGYSLLNRFFNISDGKSNYVKELYNIVKDLGFTIEGFKKRAYTYIKTVDLSYSVSLKLLNRIKPESVWVLCYYSPSVMGLLVAAHHLSIPTIDLQHGGQGMNHLAYSSWQQVPSLGYEALPNFFYTWDESSAEIINIWADKTEKHSAVKFGNPWVEGWKKGQFNHTEYDWPDNIVLYTLQPSGDPLESYLLETIKKTKDQYSWWFRLHPRQIDETESIKLTLHEHNLLNYVNIDDATQLHLPEILIHTKVHLTKFSGCAIEAYQFNIPTVIIDIKGANLFEEYIKSSTLMSSYLAEDSNGLIDIINKSFHQSLNNTT